MTGRGARGRGPSGSCDTVVGGSDELVGQGGCPRVAFGSDDGESGGVEFSGGGIGKKGEGGPSARGVSGAQRDAAAPRR